MEPDAQIWDTVRTYVAQACGVTLAQDQDYLLHARLDPVAQGRGFASVYTFVQAACQAPQRDPLAQLLIDAMTTHESFFFRDQAFWQVFEEEVMPRLAHLETVPNFWCAACAHGQEAYTIAMLLEERWPHLADRVRIVATDVSAPAIERGHAGIFTGLEVNRGLNAARIARHFEPVRGGFRVKDKLRRRITWDVHNLLSAKAPVENVAVVTCRNVMIYMDEACRRLTLTGVLGALLPHGYVGLGATESLDNAPSQRGWYRREALGRLP